MDIDLRHSITSAKEHTGPLAGPESAILTFTAINAQLNHTGSQGVSIICRVSGPEVVAVQAYATDTPVLLSISGY
jgi:hypothetical protein